MKYIVITILVLFLILKANCQEAIDKSLDSLNNIKTKRELTVDSLRVVIKNLENEIQQINVDISKIKTKQKFGGENKVATVTIGKGILRDSPSIFGDTIVAIPPGEIVYAFTFEDQFYGIVWGDLSGYINEMYLKKTNELIEFADNLKFEKERQRILEQEERNRHLKLKAEERKKQEQIEREEYIKRIIGKYGIETGQKLLNGQYWIGMTDEMARVSLGAPNDINKTVGSWGVHEQWIYRADDIYLYFENGILTSYQN
jgi:hypothetical protein